MRAVSTIRVRSLGDRFAFGSIVAAGWSISRIKVRAGRVEWLMTDDKGARRYTVVAPPPDLRDQREEEILDAVWRVA
jgi:hypothetical protein